MEVFDFNLEQEAQTRDSIAYRRRKRKVKDNRLSEDNQQVMVGEGYNGPLSRYTVSENSIDQCSEEDSSNEVKVHVDSGWFGTEHMENISVHFSDKRVKVVIPGNWAHSPQNADLHLNWGKEDLRLKCKYLANNPDPLLKALVVLELQPSAVVQPSVFQFLNARSTDLRKRAIVWQPNNNEWVEQQRRITRLPGWQGSKGMWSRLVDNANGDATKVYLDRPQVKQQSSKKIGVYKSMDELLRMTMEKPSETVASQSLDSLPAAADADVQGSRPRSLSPSPSQIVNRRSQGKPRVDPPPIGAFVYPCGDPDAVTVSHSDLQRLEPREFLNDTLIDFYIKYLQQSLGKEVDLRRYHFFNSFFFKKLLESPKHTPGVRRASEAAFGQVEKWTRSVDLFAKDFIVVPINENLHWSLAIICHPGQVMDFQDWGRGQRTKNSSSSSPPLHKQPCIIHLDSLQGDHSRHFKILRSYLCELWLRCRFSMSRSQAQQAFESMHAYTPKVPQQDNLCDCGLFLLHYVEKFMNANPPAVSLNRDHTCFPHFLSPSWFKPHQASAKRVHMQVIIRQLYMGSKDSGTEGGGARRLLAHVLPAEGEEGEEEEERSRESAAASDVETVSFSQPAGDNCSPAAAAAVAVSSTAAAAAAAAGKEEKEEGGVRAFADSLALMNPQRANPLSAAGHPDAEAGKLPGKSLRPLEDYLVEGEVEADAEAGAGAGVPLDIDWGTVVKQVDRKEEEEEVVGVSGPEHAPLASHGSYALLPLQYHFSSESSGDEQADVGMEAGPAAPRRDGNGFSSEIRELELLLEQTQAYSSPVTERGGAGRKEEGRGATSVPAEADSVAQSHGIHEWNGRGSGDASVSALQQQAAAGGKAEAEVLQPQAGADSEGGATRCGAAEAAEAAGEAGNSSSEDCVVLSAGALCEVNSKQASSVANNTHTACTSAPHKPSLPHGRSGEEDGVKSTSVAQEADQDTAVLPHWDADELPHSVAAMEPHSTRESLCRKAELDGAAAMAGTEEGDGKSARIHRGMAAMCTALVGMKERSFQLDMGTALCESMGVVVLEDEEEELCPDDGLVDKGTATMPPDDTASQHKDVAQVGKSPRTGGLGSLQGRRTARMKQTKRGKKVEKSDFMPVRRSERQRTNWSPYNESCSWSSDESTETIAKPLGKGNAENHTENFMYSQLGGTGDSQISALPEHNSKSFVQTAQLAGRDTKSLPVDDIKRHCENGKSIKYLGWTQLPSQVRRKKRRVINLSSEEGVLL